MRSTDLFDLIGQENIFATEDQAINEIYHRLGDQAADDLFCSIPARA
jgi:SulP family sulfate permease